MVNVGLRAYLWRQKSENERVSRELWRLNGRSFEAYRRYTEALKEKLAAQPNDAAAAKTALPYVFAGALPGHPKYEFSAALPQAVVAAGIATIAEASEAPVAQLQFANSRPNLLACGCDNGMICILQLHGTGVPDVQHLHGHKQRIISLAWSLDDSLLLTAAQDGGLCIWQAETAEMARTFMLRGLTCCSFYHLNQNLVVVGHSSGKVTILNASTGKEQANWSPPAKAAAAVTAMTVAGSLIFAADSIGAVHTMAYEAKGDRLKVTARWGPSGPGLFGLCHSSFSCLAQGPALLASFNSRRLLVLRVGPQNGRLEPVADTTYPRAAQHCAAAFCPLARFKGPEYCLQGCGDSGVVILTVSAGGKPLVVNELQGHQSPICSTAWSCDDALLASGDASGIVIIWKRQMAARIF